MEQRELGKASASSGAETCTQVDGWMDVLHLRYRKEGSGYPEHGAAPSHDCTHPRGCWGEPQGGGTAPQVSD